MVRARFAVALFVLFPATLGAQSPQPGQWTSKNLVTGEVRVLDAAPPLPPEIVTRLMEGGEPARVNPTGLAGTASVGNLTVIADASVWPYSPHARLQITYDELTNSTGIGSGTMIGPQHVLTTGRNLHRDATGYADEIIVSPGYSDALSPKAPFGTAKAVVLYSWDGWTNDHDDDHDLGVILLDRPVGALSGWKPIGYHNDNDFFKEGTWEILAYSNIQGGTRSLTVRTGQFDGTDYSWPGGWYGNEVWLSSTFLWPAEVGGAAMRNGGIYAVYSNMFGEPFDPFRSHAVRLTSGKYTDVQGWLASDIPDLADLIPMDMRLASSQGVAGDPMPNSDVLIYNRGETEWTGSFEMRVYLSENDLIASAQDMLLGTQTSSYTIPPNGFRVVGFPTYFLPNALASGQYHVGVLLTAADAVTANNRTGSQDVAKLNIGCPPDQVPVLVAPLDGATCVPAPSFMFDWTAGPGVQEFQVRLTNIETGLVQLVGTTNTYYTWGSLAEATDYVLDVRSRMACTGEWTEWSGYAGFTTEESVPPVPVLVSPPNGDVCAYKEMLVWEALPNASSYRIQVGTSCGTGAIYTVSSPFWDSSGLVAGPDYYWRVAGRTSCGENGPWSACRSFRTVAAPPPPVVPAFPVDDAECMPTTLVLKWHPVTDGVEYRVRLTDQGCFGFDENDSTWVTADTSVVVLNLESNRTYAWGITATNSCGLESNETCYTFSTQGGTGPAAPVNLQPAASVTCGSGPGLSWDPSPTASGYQINVGGTLYLSGSPAFNPGFLGAGNYVWSVRASSACAGYGPWSSSRSFTVTPGTVFGGVIGLESESHTLGQWSTDPLILSDWRAPAAGPCKGVDGYSIVWDSSPTTVPDATWDILKTASFLEATDGADQWFHVRAVDGAGVASGITEHLGPFHIDATPPAVTVIEPAEGDAAVTTGLTPISWTASDPTSGLTELSVWYSADGGQNFTLIGDYPTTTTSITWIPTIMGIDYRIMVRATDLAGNITGALSGRFFVSDRTGVDGPDTTPTFHLAQNQPNPFNSSTRIRFEVPQDTPYTLEVFSVRGRRLLLRQGVATGPTEVHWDGTDGAGREVPRGIYFYRLNAGSYTESRRMVRR